MPDMGDAGRGASHAHEATAALEPAGRAIIERGYRELLAMTERLEYRPTPSERCPLPLAQAFCGAQPEAARARAAVERGIDRDPVGALESALALLELHECNQEDIAEHVPEDGPFTETCFSSKRLNGWIALMGDADAGEVESVINGRWQFRFFNGPPRPTGIYVLLNMLARYALVYGKIAPGDSHGLGHFVEDFTPGLIICRGGMSDLELTLSLAAMKMGVPAIVPPEYPFPLGRTLSVESTADLADAVMGFPNIRRLLTMPDLPQYPPYCDRDNVAEKFEPASVWGDTAESFYILRKGAVAAPGEVKVTGAPEGPMGVIVTVEAEPMDAFDRAYIERSVAVSPSMMKGVMASYDGDRLVLRLREGTKLDPGRVGDVLIAAVRHEFPKIEKVAAEVIFERSALKEEGESVRAEKQRREKAMSEASEETVDHFYTCVGCSAFAPNHVCILTPERTPICGRPFGQIKTGALYGYDDMTNIHHNRLHREMNSFGVVDKGECLDPVAGEWGGVNERAAALSGGRTMRVLLHSLDDNPHTGCGCFSIVMFKTDRPRGGIGVMDAGYGGRAPDGRSWRDLHYSLAGKQTPGVSGASPVYLRSPKFLAAHGGWRSVVWVSPAIAQLMGDELLEHVGVGPAAELS